MRDHFLRRLAFHSWANRNVSTALHTAPEVEEAERLLAHIAAAETIYLQRIREADPWPQDFWPELGMKATLEALHHNYNEYLSLLLASPPSFFQKPIAYRTSKGVRQVTPVWELLEQMLAHGIHHRAQINLHLRKAGHAPPAVGYIEFSREVPPGSRA